MRDFAETIGIDRNRYVTREQSLSEVADKPTILEFTKQCVLPAGEPVFDITRWTLVTSPLPVHMGWYAEAIGHLDGSTFRGTYSSRMLAEPKGGPLQIRQWIFMRGTFAVELRTL